MIFRNNLILRGPTHILCCSSGQIIFLIFLEQRPEFFPRLFFLFIKTARYLHSLYMRYVSSDEDFNSEISWFSIQMVSLIMISNE